MARYALQVCLCLQEPSEGGGHRRSRDLATRGCAAADDMIRDMMFKYAETIELLVADIQHGAHSRELIGRLPGNTCVELAPMVV
mmetsp:Transcript_14685/g.22161  ORF Transcript_14685/g.22161 Transcript_14685/m.22161 type:complete len:84 (-) Transcript_14685:26-277(-)